VAGQKEEWEEGGDGQSSSNASENEEELKGFYKKLEHGSNWEDDF
jgi:hypothetical protein